MKFAFFGAITISAALAAAPAAAVVTTFSLPDIGTFADYTETYIGQSYSGNGFVGMYGPSTGSADYAHLFGLEGPDYSRTLAQVDISGLTGATIHSATLTFDLLDGSNVSANLAVTGYNGSGALNYMFNAPAINYGVVNGTAAQGANSVNVTSLLAAAVAADADWLNLHLATDAPSLWTYTYSGFGYSADRANVRLTVDYDVSAVPEPAQWALLIGGFAFAGATLRRRRGPAGARAAA